MKNFYLIPLSIVVAGLVIAGAILYQPENRAGQAGQAVVKTINYVDLAGTLGLDKAKFKACIETHQFKDEIARDAQAGNEAGVSGTPTSFINGRKVEGAVPFAAYQAAIEDAFNDTKPLSDVNLDEIVPSADDDAVLGDQNAPVTMVVFGDYQCPFCEQAYSGAEKQVRDTYVKSGKVNMVFRDYPLTNIHPAAQPAAEAAECAGAQGKYWEYHDALFDNQAGLPNS